MAQEILLLNDVEKLGKAGDVVKVADGYARNYLLPQGLAAPVSNHALRRLEKLRKEREELNRIRLAEAKTKASRLKDASVTLRAKVIDENRLYGSVTIADIITAINAELQVDLDKSQLELEEAIKETGTYDLQVRLHPEVTTSLKVWIVEE